MSRLKALFGIAVLLFVSFAGIISYKGYQQQRLHSGTTPVAQALNAYVEQRAKANEFSGTVLMAKDGTPILTQGYNFANLQKNIPNTGDTVYCIASVGKLFTAVAIGQLVEQGKLSFNAPIGKYISGFSSNIADNITIGELLDMTGGFGNVAPVASNKPITLADQMKLIYGEKLVSQPGVTFNYSNDGYIVLGAIIQQVSDEPYATYIQRHIFAPAGMDNTSISVYKPEDVANMAHGYTDQEVSGKWTDISNTYEIGNPSGGAYSTVGDLLKFAQALTNHKLMSTAMTSTILIPRVSASLPGGPEYTYGFGYQKENGVVFVGHNGGGEGFEDQIDVYPDKGYVVVVMTNKDNSMAPVIQESEKLLTQ